MVKLRKCHVPLPYTGQIPMPWLNLVLRGKFPESRFSIANMRDNHVQSLVTNINFIDVCECHLLPYCRTLDINKNNNIENLTVITVL